MLWFKALHIIAVVCWFAGIFYLPRLFVYHAMAEDAATQRHLSTMEQKLYRFVSPFAMLTVIFGIAMMAYNPNYYLHAGWLWLKPGRLRFLGEHAGHEAEGLANLSRCGRAGGYAPHCSCLYVDMGYL